MDAFERGFGAMQNLVMAMSAAVQNDINEADTRYRVIDGLLREVLMWQDIEVHNELHSEVGYLDYCVGSPGSQFVLEAKRVGLGFELPVGLSSSVVSIPSISNGAAGKELRSALQQAARYAQERGIPIAVAFNGHQLVVFMASRTDGLPPLEGRALVFATPQSMIDEFLVLWNNLSPRGLQERTIYQTLQSTVPLPPDPLALRLNGYPGNQRRNDLQTGLQILGDLFLGDLDELQELQEDFLRECYASSGALSQYAEVSKQILANRYDLLDDLGLPTVQDAVDRKGVTKGFTTDVLQAAMSNRPVILLGDVGSGKSTFIERLIYVDAKDVLGESICIYVDLGASSALKSLSEHVLETAVSQLREDHGTNVLSLTFAEDALRSDLRLFDESPLGSQRLSNESAYHDSRVRFIQDAVNDKSNYLRKAFEWIRKSWHRQIVIFLDNVDQRSADDQNEVFLIANELAQTWPATVFVTLRPETFYNSEREGAISGYHPRVFTISPPRTDVMLKLRVQFALKQLQSAGRLGSFPEGVKVNSDSLELFLNMLEKNFGKNEQLMRLVDNLAGGNMRIALQYVTDFIGSGHIDTEKIIDKQRRFGYYTIPVHEFLRSIMFGDNRYYDPDSSPIPNLFRITRRDPKEHFLLPMCLAFVQKTGDLDTEHGYVSSQQLFAHLQSLGFDPTQVTEALEYAIRFRLLDATRRYGKRADEEVFRITTVGAYAYKSLPDKFTYFDAIAVDVSVLDEDVRRSLRDVVTLIERVERVELLVGYLNAQWAKVPAGSAWDWGAAHQSLLRDLRQVRDRAKNS